jgi:hypothetical protein
MMRRPRFRHIRSRHTEYAAVSRTYGHDRFGDRFGRLIEAKASRPDLTYNPFEEFGDNFNLD